MLWLLNIKLLSLHAHRNCQIIAEIDFCISFLFCIRIFGSICFTWILMLFDVHNRSILLAERKTLLGLCKSA